MEIWIAILGLFFLLAGLAFAAGRVWKMGQRGWKDHLWIWDDANRAATFLLIIFGGQGVARWVWRGWSDEAMAFLIAAAVTIPIPYIAYITGRLLGIRDRARHGTRLS
jgi:hypothetical protein